MSGLELILGGSLLVVLWCFAIAMLSECMFDKKNFQWDLFFGIGLIVNLISSIGLACWNKLVVFSALDWISDCNIIIASMVLSEFGVLISYVVALFRRSFKKRYTRKSKKEE